MIRELKRIIKKQIDPISPLALDVMPQANVFPHVVMHITMDMVKEGLHNIVVDFDVWDKGSSTKNIDEIAEKIESKLDRLHLTEKGISAAIYHVSTNNVIDTDSSVRRKTCTFEIQVRKG